MQVASTLSANTTRIRMLFHALCSQSELHGLLLTASPVFFQALIGM